MAPRNRSRRRPSGSWAALLLLSFAPAAAVGTRASAAEVDLSLITTGQGYQTQRADGEVLDRRRLSEWVFLRADRLFGVERLSLDLDFRLDLDLGLPEGAQGRDSASLNRASVGWQEGGERLLLRLGRQVVLDELDFLYFDGLRSDVRLWGGLELRLLLGLSVRDRSLLGGEWLELDGVEQGATPAPVLGASLSFARELFTAEISYRRTLLWEDGWPLDEERLGAAGSLRLLGGRLGLDGGASYDLLQDRFDRVRAEGFCAISPGGHRLRLEAGFLRSHPLFALDSIFSFFSPAPFSEVRAGARWQLPAKAAAAVAYRRRWYGGGIPAESVDGVEAEGSYRLSPRHQLALAFSAEAGATGLRLLAAPRFSWELLEDLSLEGRALFSSFDDPLQESQHAVTFGGSAAACYRFGESQAVLLVAEANGNRLQPFRTRVMLVLDLQFHFGPGGFP